MNNSHMLNMIRSILVDHIIWSACKGHGSYFTFEIGSPHLTVRDPIANSKMEKLRRRRAKVIGDCTAWIQDCHWEITDQENVLASSNSSNKAMMTALDFINGGLIKDFTCDEGKFAISLDNSTISARYKNGIDATALSMHFINGHVFSFQGSGAVNYELFAPQAEFDSRIEFQRLSEGNT